MTNDAEAVQDFLVEATEILEELDRSFVALERSPEDRECLGAIFRAVHTLKGGSGFLGLRNLGGVAHAGEAILSRLRDGALSVDTTKTTALLAMVDAIRTMVHHVETTGQDGTDDHAALVSILTSLAADAPSKPASLDVGDGLLLFDDAPEARPALPVPAMGVPKDVVITDATAIHGAALQSPAQRPDTSSETAVKGPESSRRPPVHPAIPPALSQALAAMPIPAIRSLPAPAMDLHSLVPGSLAPGPLESRAPGPENATVRVDVRLLDGLMNLVGELVLARNRVTQLCNASNDPSFVQAAQRVSVLTTELQAGVMKTRMQPISTIWSKLLRLVRDVSLTCGKDVRLELEGQTTELDRSILEAIKDPLTHAIRNAIDHGIETPAERRAAGKSDHGTLLLRAFHEGGKVNIDIVDDGRGLDIDRIRARGIERGLVTAESAARMTEREIAELVFSPGFSTAKQVTQVSGRGVGMDVVKTNVEKIGGSVEIHTVAKRGSTIKLKIPLTLAIVPALVVETAGERFAIPQVNVTELVRLEGESLAKNVESIGGAFVYRLRGSLLPLVFLERELALRDGRELSDVLTVVVIHAEDATFGLVVDGVSDTQEIVVKPLGKAVKDVPGFAGATIMGDGRVALILDVIGLARRANLLGGARRARATSELAPVESVGDKLLLCRVGDETRAAVPLASVERLETIAAHRVERALGQEVVQYRGGMLPLIDVGRELGIVAGRGEVLSVLVCRGEGGAHVGLIVAEILDVATDTYVPSADASKALTDGVAVLHGKITERIDLERLLRTSGVGPFCRSDAA